MRSPARLPVGPAAATAAGLIGLGFSACQSGGGGGSGPRPNGNNNPGRCEVLNICTPLDFGMELELEFEPDVPRSIAVQIDPRPELPQFLARGEVMIDKSAVRLIKRVDAGRVRAQSAPDRVTIALRVASSGAMGPLDPCRDGLPLGTFTLTLNEAGDDYSVAPEAIELLPIVFESFQRRTSALCVDLSANFAGTLAMSRLRIGSEAARVEDGSDRASVVLVIAGMEAARMTAGAGFTSFRVGRIPDNPAFGATAGAYEFFAQIGGADGEAQFSLVVASPSDLTGEPRNAAGLRGSMIASVFQRTSTTVAAACSPEFAAICAIVGDTPVSGAIALNLSGGRLTGTFDLTFDTVQMTDEGEFANVTLSAAGDIDLPEAYLQLAD